MLVEAFVPQPTVEALDRPILHRLARRDVVPLDLALLLPSERRVRPEFGAIVRDNRRRAFPAKVVDDGEHAEPAPVRQGHPT